VKRMETNRREFLTRVVGGTAAAGLVLGTPRPAEACLWGTWWVYCRNCHQVDTVEQGTCQHICENKQCRQQVFYGDDGRSVTVVCRNGHLNPIHTGTRDDPTYSYKCTDTTCNKTECRADGSDPPPRPRGPISGPGDRR
jgi:hypothetical protein